MNPQSFNHEWDNHTTVHPAGLLAVLLCGFAMLLVDRRWALVPVIVMACFVAPAQRIVVASLDFNFLRLMVLFAGARIVMRGEYRGVRPGALDLLVLAWTASAVTIYSLQWGTLDAFINRLGFAYDTVGLYAMVRCLVRSWEDVRSLAVGVAAVSLPVAACFALEMTTGHNLFAALGGVPEETMVRQGKVRCQGAFGHPILAGAFFASLAPLTAALWWWGRRGWAALGTVAIVLIVAATSSSTTFIALAAAAGTMMLYPLRAWRYWAVGGVMFGAGLTHLAMRAPIWHLLAQTDVVGGSTGYYRYMLVQQFVSRVDEWWLLGVRTTADWWPWGMTDLVNQFVLEGVQGGMLTLGLFVTVVIGAMMSADGMLRRPASGRRALIPAWALVACMAAHLYAFLGVSYYAQGVLAWSLTLGLIGSAAEFSRRAVADTEAPAPQPIPARRETLRELLLRRARAGARGGNAPSGAGA